MNGLFKQTEKTPFAYPSIEMRKSSRSYYKWIAVVIVIILLTIFLFRFLV